ncbi:MAG: ATP-dependent DNA helicase DinG [Treponema sp.]|jgi:ATP-dependent DNA helicase DinG|nr:ATP-dependent DNA helicase DinG [Treponema sp.]
MQADKRFTAAAIKKLRSEIDDADGNEVFALGYLDDKNRVCKIEIAARGNINSVLALQDRLASFEPSESSDSGDENATPDVLIHNHPSGNLTPSDNDFIIASRAAEGGLGSFIVDNQVEKVYAVAEPARKRIRQKLDTDSIIAALEEGGAVAARLQVYEVRQSQLDLMRLVTMAFNEDALAAAEAGTGVGKSFAYLLPALSFALLNDERVVISTATINLQQQLFEKDIPLVAEALPKVLSKTLLGEKKGGVEKTVKAVLIKGRGNYICRRRLEDALKEPSLDEEENESLRAIVLWADKAETGSRSELSFVPQEGLWSRVCSEGDLCLGLRCPERERCFVMALRREAADANILVVNHHLLFADLAARQGGAGYDNTVVLPPYRRVIIDEAHNIEEAATSFFSGEFSRVGIFRSLSRLYRKNRRGTARSGLLLRLAALLPSEQARAFFGDGMDGEDKIADNIEKVRAAVEDLDEAGLELCASDGVFRLISLKEEAISSKLKKPLLSLKKKIQILASLIRDMLEHVPGDSTEEGLIWEIKAIIRHLENSASLCASFMEYRENPDKVFWIEKHSGGRGADWALFTETPLEVAHNLKESLFAPNKTVVCVSATLTVGQGETSFNYWKNRCGLDLMEDEPLTGIYPSPFPYHKSVLLGVPDAPMPTETGFSDFVDNAAAELCEIAGGSALVLFTSYSALKSAFETAKPQLEEQGIRVLKQGDDDRSRLLKAFLEDKSSVLFATDSFWQGVDAPGDTLRLVIICRLPFRTPNDPVFEARCERLEEAGGNSFMDLSLPEAVMKFKQGFGRLMRRSSDRGVVAILDSRLLKKQYGRIFLQSLPETRTCFGSLKDLLHSMEDFLF